MGWGGGMWGSEEVGRRDMGKTVLTILHMSPYIW